MIKENNNDEGLKKVIGVPALSLSILNGVIGAGIFALPGIIGFQLGAFGIFSYLFCGIMMAAIMLCYAEIGSKISSSGGSYAYVEAAFGAFPAYVINWLYFFGWSILGSAALVNVIADSIAGIFPSFGQPMMRAIVFFVLIGLIIGINIRGAKQGVLFIQVITIIKMLPLIGLIILGLGKVSLGNLTWQHTPSVYTFGNTALILFFAFSGFETCFGASGEIKNPSRTIPRGVIIGGSTVLVIYILLQIVTQGILGDGLKYAKDAPLAALANQLIGSSGGIILLVAAAISCFGSVFMDIMATPRTLFAMANNGVFPSFLGKVHTKFATPYLAVACYGAAIFLFSVAGSFQQLASLASAAILLIYLGVVLSVIRLRLQEKKQECSFTAPGGWVTPFIAVVSIGWLLSSLSKPEMINTGVFILIVSILYFSMRWIKRPSSVAIFKD